MWIKRVLLSVGVLLVGGTIVAVGGYGWYLRPDFVEPPVLPGTMHRDSLEHGGLMRSWLAYIPRDLADPTPIVLALHGSNMDGEEMIEFTSYEFNVLAEEHGFIAVYPSGYRFHWNDCRRNASYAANQRNVDDVGFLRALVARVERTYEIERGEVFAVGGSNGGHMVYRLGYEAPDLVDGIAAIVANLPAEGNLACEQAGVPVPTLIINGTEDEINPYGGGLVDFFGDTSRGRVLSSRASAEYWARLAGYNEPGQTEEWPDRDPDDGTKVSVTTWSEPSKPTVALITVHGVATHSPTLFRVSHAYWGLQAANSTQPK